MNRPQTNMNVIVRVTFLILLAFLMLTGFAVFVLIVFVPVMGWYIWRQQDRIRDLEARLAALDTRKKPDQN